MYGNYEKNQLSFRNNTAIYHPVNNELLQNYNRTKNIIIHLISVAV